MPQDAGGEETEAKRRRVEEDRGEVLGGEPHRDLYQVMKLLVGAVRVRASQQKARLSRMSRWRSKLSSLTTPGRLARC